MVVVGEFVGGALLGSAFGILLEAVVEAAKTVSSFQSNLKKMESILSQIVPIINEIEQLNKALDIPKIETSTLKKDLEIGAETVIKCAKVRCWNYTKRHRYSSKLEELENLLETTFTFVVPAQTLRDIKKTQLDLKHQFRGLTKKGSCGSVPGLSPGRHVGLYVPLMELKRDLSKDDVQVLTLTAPGGYGKTTLVKLLCADKDVQDKFGKNIIFITVTKTANLEDIVRSIFYKYCDQAPDFLNEEVGINQVEALLRDRGSKPILLVLDRAVKVAQTTPFL